MSGNAKTNGGENGSQASSNSRRTTRVWIIWAAVIGGIVLLLLFKATMGEPGEILSQYRFQQLLQAGQITHATINYNPQNSALNEIVGKYYKPEDDRKVEVPFRATVRLTRELEAQLLMLPQFEPREPNTMLFSFFVSVLPIIVIAVLIWFLFIRHIKRVSRSPAGTAQVVLTTSEQQARFDQILDKWEEQGRRVDAVLDKMEHPEAKK